MKNKNVLLMFTFILLATNTACGRNYAGKYTGNMSMTVNGVLQSSPVTVTFNDSSGNGLVTGTIAGTSNGSITSGTPAGDTISNVAITMNPTSVASAYMTTPAYSQVSTSCSYTGSLTVSNNQLVSSLTQSQTAAVLPGVASYSQCGTLSITGTKQ